MAEVVEVCIGVMREIGVALKGAKGVMGLRVGLVREVGFRQIGGVVMVNARLKALSGEV